jgi:mono/diheme cytochrome c family protein
MVDGRRTAAGGVLLLCFVSAAAIGQQREPPTGSGVDTSERKAAAPAQQAVPAKAPPGNVEHGRYLVHHVAMCVECHSPRDANGEIIAGKEFTGAPLPFRPPDRSGWALRAPRNRGLPGYTPELAIRLLTQGGVDREGKQLRPPMPHFRMTVQDAADVFAYLTSLP